MVDDDPTVFPISFDVKKAFLCVTSKQERKEKRHLLFGSKEISKI